MAKSKTPAPVPVVDIAPEGVAPLEAPVATPAPEKKKRTEATVTWSGGSRTYSLKVHGEDFEDLAKQFAKKFNGTLA